MPLIDLGEPRIVKPVFRLMEFGATMTPFLGGPSQRLRRIGTRYAIDVTTIPMDMEPEGRILVARLKRGKQAGVRMRWVQPGLVIGAVGAPTVRTATAGGMTLPITGGQPGGVLREGQMFSLSSGGRSYLYGIAAGIVLDANGAADVALEVPLRAIASVGDAVELTAPVIEGRIAGQDWTYEPDVDGVVAPQFAIEERA